MKALILHLKEVPYTIESALIAGESCKTFDVEPQLFEGYVPSKANEYIKQKGLGFYDPGPKLYRIKNKKGGVRGCMVSHLEMWHEVVRRNETTIIMEHDAQMVRDTWRAEFDDIMHCAPADNLKHWDGHTFEDDDQTDTIVEQWTFQRKGEIQFKGTYGYVIKPHAAKRLIEAAYDDGITAADMFIKQKYINLQYVKPRAILVRSKQSLSSDRTFEM
jgi:GR25 family glycosyltransferase involved in LPS biosynthesis